MDVPFTVAALQATPVFLDREARPMIRSVEPSPKAGDDVELDE